jgi:hypothetical protein
MDPRTTWAFVLLAAMASGCRANDTGLLRDGSAGQDAEVAEPSQRPAPPPIVLNLDGGIAPPVDAAPDDVGAPVADAGTLLPDAVTSPAADAAPPPPDARPTADTATADAAPPRVDMLDGCQIVACEGMPTRHDCCRAWYHFALESEDRNQVQRDQLVTSFTKGADIRASYAFDRPGQDGAVGMLLDKPRRVTAIRIANQSGGAAGGSPFVTTEATNGTAGCAYSLGPGGAADLARPLYCWGDRALMPDRINIRIEAKAAGAANIRVTAVEVR